LFFVLFSVADITASAGQEQQKDRDRLCSWSGYAHICARQVLLYDNNNGHK
jgi:hypothetical protein